MNATRTEEVAGYAAAVRAALADLPADVREELLEDLEDHLDEVAEEEGSLPERLGPPHVYADELRSSAGLPVGPATDAGRRPRGPSPLHRLEAQGRRLYAQVDALPWGHAVLQFLPELRPAWWVLRGYVAVQILAAVLPESDPRLPVPELLGAEVVGLMAVLAAIAVSVSIARRELDHRQQRVLTAANIVLAVLAFGMFLALGSVSVTPRYAADYGEAGPLPAAGLVRPNGSAVTNLYPFDANGRPLRDIFLYDQDGRPVELGESAAPDGMTYGEPRRSLDGREVGNVFPLRQYRLDYGPQGEVKMPVPGGPPNVGVPKLAPQPPLPQLVTPEEEQGLPPSPAPGTTSPSTTAPGTTAPSTTAPTAGPASPTPPARTTPPTRAATTPATPR